MDAPTSTPSSSTTSTEDLEHQVEHLQRALQNARVIGIAIGVLMARHRCTRQDAFAMLRAASQRTNRKVAELAADVADHGDLGDTPAGSGRSYGKPPPRS